MNKIATLFNRISFQVPIDKQHFYTDELNQSMIIKTLIESDTLG